MPKVAFTNTKKHAVHVGGKTIMPGHTREVDETLVPGYKPPAVEAEVVDEKAELLVLLDESVPVIVANLVDLSDDDLETLRVAEENGKTRKGVIAAIADERLTRASATQDSTDPDTFAASLAEISDEELFALSETFADDEAKLALVKAEGVIRHRASLEAMDAESFATHLVEKSDEELLELAELFDDSEATLALVNAEIEKRG